MAGEFDQSIDTSQAELSSQAPKEQEVRRHEEVYGSLVDQFQGMDSKLKLDTPEAKKEVDKGKKEVGDLLRRMAERGKWLIEGPVPSSGPDDKKSDKKSADKKGAVPKETTEIHSLASSLRGTLDTYGQKLTAISSIIEKKREAFNLLTAAYRVEASADVVNVAPFVPPVFIEAIDKALYGEGGDGGCMAVYKMLRNNIDLPKEFVQETLLNIEEKQTQRLLELKIRGQQHNLIDTQKLGDEALSKLVEMEAPKKKGEQPVFRFTEAGEQLSAEQKQLVLQAIAGVRETNYEQVEAATCPKATERFWNGKAHFEAGQFQEAKATLEAFIKEDLSTVAISSDPKLKGKSDAYEKQSKNILAQIEKVDGANKDFFSAQELAQAGDIIGAKKLLKKYLAEHKEKKEDEADFTGSARELLKRIALVQIRDAREKFQEYNKRPPEKIQRSKGSGRNTRSEMIDNPEYAKWQKYKEALGTIEREISSGKYTDFTDAYNAISAEMGGFDNKDAMNTLADQLILDNGRAGLLELARKYREMGKYFGDPKYLALAEQYFQEYFAKKLGETAQKYVTIQDLRKKYDSNTSFHSGITNKVREAKKQYEEKAAKDPEWAQKNPWDEQVVRIVIENQAFSQMQTEETVKMQNRHFNSNTSNVGDAGDQAAWGEFMNMKGLHGEGKWFEPFALSDEQVGRLVKDLPVDIAIIAASAALAAATAGAASGALFTVMLSTAERELIRQGGKIAARHLLAESVKYGGRFAGRRMLAGAAGFAIETAMFTASHSVMNSVRTGELSIASFDQFMIEWGENVKVMGLLGLAGRASAALRLGRVSSIGVEMAAMGSMHGKLTVDDWAIVLGLKIGHALPKAPGKVREALAERKAKKQAERAAVRNEKIPTLHRSEFLVDASKIPPEMRGKPAYIGKDGKIYYAPDAFAEFGVRAETKGKNTIYTIEDVGGPYRGNRVELTEREFLRIEMRAKNGEPLTPLQQALLPTVRAVREKQIELKNHEVNHRALETANNKTNGRLAKALEKLFAENPGLKRALEERSATANRAKEGFQSIQEFLSEVAGGKTVRLTAEQAALVEGVIAKAGGIKGFTFRGVRNVDTRMLADPAYLREHFRRDAEAGRDELADRPSMERQMPHYRPKFTEDQIMNGHVPTGSEIRLMGPVPLHGGGTETGKVLYQVLGFVKEHWYSGNKKYKLFNPRTRHSEFLTPTELRERINEMKPEAFHETPGFRAGERLNLPGSRFDGFYVIADHKDGTVMVTRNEPDMSKALVGERTTWSEILQDVEVAGNYIERVYQDKVYVWHKDPQNPTRRIGGPAISKGEYHIPLSEVLDQLQNRNPAPAPAPEKHKIKLIKPNQAPTDPLGIGQEVYVQRSSGVIEKGWVIKEINPDGSYEVWRGKIHRPVRQDLSNPANNEVWSIDRIERQADSRDSLGNDAADFERMKIALLKQTELLPSRDFDQLFTDAGLHQENVGNCYMVSAIHSLYNSPHFKFLVQTSVKRVPDGWEVRIPLGDPNAKPILVTEADLQPQDNSANYGKRDKHGEVDDRKYLRPMAGSKGFQVLEAALIRRVTFSPNGPLDRLGAEGGFGHQAIIQLLGSTFRKVKLDGSRGLHPPEQRGMAGTAREYSEAPAFSDADHYNARQVRNDLYGFLDGFHPGKYLATANTPPAARGDRARFRVPGVNYEFHNSHAYSIVNVDSFGNPKTVSVVNPHNTTQTIKLTYEQFATVFSQVSAAEIDYSKYVAQMRNRN